MGRKAIQMVYYKKGGIFYMSFARRRRCLLLIVVILSSLLVGCDSLLLDTTPVHIETTPHINHSGDQNDVNGVSGFTITEQRQHYAGNDIILLNMQNQTENDYTVTVIGKYMDKKGNVIKTEKQTFIGWGAGYQNYILFQPDIIFESFDYTLELENYRGVCYAQKITVLFDDIKEEVRSIVELIVNKNDFSQYSQLNAYWPVINNNVEAVNFEGYFILLNENGDVVRIARSTAGVPGHSEDQVIKQMLYYEQTKEKLTWPEEFAGNLSGICAVRSVTKQIVQ